MGSALVGATLVLITPSLRDWAEGPFGQSDEATARRYLAVAVLALVFSYSALRLLRVSRPVRMLLTALCLQISALWGVERLDGYRLPLWLDLVVAVLTWSTAWLIASRR